jgi:hypothetical protein
MKHTPGPWRYIICDTIQRGRCFWFYREKSNKPIAHIDTWELDTDIMRPFKEHEANAHLIAAAPDMLEALARLETAATNRDNTMGDPCRLIECKAELEAAAKHARVTIAKAKGE